MTRDGVAVTAKAEGLQEGTDWGKGGYTSVRADEMAGKINKLPGRRLFGSLSWKVKRAYFPWAGRTLRNNMVRNLDLVPKC